MKPDVFICLSLDTAGRSKMIRSNGFDVTDSFPTEAFSNLFFDMSKQHREQPKVIPVYEDDSIVFEFLQGVGQWLQEQLVIPPCLCGYSGVQFDMPEESVGLIVEKSEDASAGLVSGHKIRNVLGRTRESLQFRRFPDSVLDRSKSIFQAGFKTAIEIRRLRLIDLKIDAQDGMMPPFGSGKQLVQF